MSQPFSFNPPAGSTPEQASTFVLGAINALSIRGRLKPLQVYDVLIYNISSITLQLLATDQVTKNASSVADGLVAAGNKNSEPLVNMFKENPILAILLHSVGGKTTLYKAYRAAGHTDHRNLDAFACI